MHLINVNQHRSDIATLKGSPKELSEKIYKIQAKHALLITFEHIKQQDLDALSHNLLQLTSSMMELLTQDQEKKTLQKVVELLMPERPPSARQFKEALRLVKAQRALLDSGDWLSAADIAQLAGLSKRNPGSQPNKWKKQNHIFAIKHGGLDYFPIYALNPGKNYRPVKEMADIIEIFRGNKDEWRMAFWFFSDNSFLGGKRPQDLLQTHPEQVIAAARDEVEGIQHG